MELAGEDERVTLAQLRDQLGVSRKFAQGLLEALDARGATRRVGDERVLPAAPTALKHRRLAPMFTLRPIES